MARIPPSLRLPLIGALALALVVIGFLLGWRLAAETRSETAIGRVSFEVRPSFGGEATAVIPVADWGFRADAFDAPFGLHTELRALNRTALARAAEGDLSVLDAAEADLEDGATVAVLRAFAWGLGATLVLLIVATLVWRELRPRWALLAAGGAIAALAGVGSLALARSTFDATAFERPTYFANGAELERILEIAEDERVSSAYGSEFASILSSVGAVLTGAPSADAAGSRDMYLGSDLHANALVIGPLSEIVGDVPFLLVGDFGQRGGEAEARAIGPRVSALGSRVVASSGNHDTTRLMEALEANEVTVLGDPATGGPESTQIDGLRLAGFPDPFEWTGLGDPESRPLTFDDLEDPEGGLEDAVADLVREFDGLNPPPEVAMVHQAGLAEALAEVLYQRGYDEDLTILTGHTHSQRVERLGRIVVVNGGSVGAGGVFDAGTQPIGLAELHFEEIAPRLSSVDLISIEPFSGEAQATRVVIDSLCPDERRCAFDPPSLDESVVDDTEEPD
jgi:Icc-related predicted phosphoesterase